MLVHVFADTPQHYHPMRRFFSEQCGIDAEQQFWVRQSATIDAPESSFIPYTTPDELINRLNQLPDATQIVFHGLFDIHIWRKLIFSAIAKRCSCVIWGAEIYRHGKSGRTLKQYIAQGLHLMLVNRFNKVISLNPGDGNLVGRYLKRRDVDVLPYPLIGLSRPDSGKSSDNDELHQGNLPLKILLGNSAAASNEHIYALEQLAHLSTDDIEIIVPLNYAGSEDYINQVIAKGRTLFGDKFKAITNMLEKSAYDQLLANVDMTVFAHERQQGLYVAYAMLLMGKPMFLRSSTTSYANLSSLGFSVQSVEALSEFDFAKLSKLVKNPIVENQTLMEQHFTEKALAPRWSRMLNNLEPRD